MAGWMRSDRQAARAYVGTEAAAAATVEERLAFIRKVYSLFFASLGVAGLGALVTMRSAAIFSAVASNTMVFFLLEIGALIFAMVVRHKQPLNVIAMFTFTLLSGMTIGVVMRLYQMAGMADVVVQAGVLTMVAFGGLTFYAFVTKRDFSFLRTFLVVGLVVLIAGGLLNMLWFHSAGMRSVMSMGGVLVFMGFILYDTQMIVRRYPVNAYTAAALALYLDFVNLFLYLLSLLSGGRD